MNTTLTTPTESDNNSLSIIRGLIMTGTIRCLRCDTAFDAKGTCPKCGYIKCYLLIYHDGKLHKIRRNIQDRPFGYVEALDTLVAVNREMREGKFNILNWLPAEINLRRFETVISQWLTQKETEMNSGSLSRGTIKDYKGYTKNHFKPMLGKLDVRKIAYNDLERFRDNLPAGLKKKTQRNILNALHSAFRWFWRKGIVNELPPFPVILGNDATKRIALTYEEQQAGLARIPEQYRDVFEFGCETGLRPGEVCVLRVWDLRAGTREALIQRNLQEGIESETTKGKRKDLIPLSDHAWAIALRHMTGQDEYLFINPDTHKRYTVKAMNQIWRKFSGIDCCWYEAGRHSFCTHLAEIEMNPLILQDLMRHATLQTTKKYCHPRAERLRKTLNQRGQVYPLSIRETKEK